MVAMSGGVDSSATAALLVKKGYNVAGIMLQLWPTKNQDAVESAQNAAETLGIPLHIKDCQEVFHQRVIEYFVRTYAQGLTPNPCVVCNKEIKFGVLLQEALALGANYLSTGHYVRLRNNDNQFALLKGIDPVKDQSYFLYRLTQAQMAHLMFPLGEYDKPAVRQMAEELGLISAVRKESQDLCFIDEMDYREFLARYSNIALSEGPITDLKGRVLGTHKGLPNYTIGQRRGLGISASEPLYVLQLNVPDNTLVVGTQNERGKHELIADDVNFISGRIPEEPFSAMARIRYTAKEQDVTVIPLPEQRMKVVFRHPLPDITPGQSVVLFDGEQLIGGGTILDWPIV